MSLPLFLSEMGMINGRISFNSPTLSELGRRYVQQTAGSLTVRMGQLGMASWRKTSGDVDHFNEKFFMKKFWSYNNNNSSSSSSSSSSSNDKTIQE